jgi:DNA-binding GntR family transcriptional regulator
VHPIDTAIDPQASPTPSPPQATGPESMVPDEAGRVLRELTDRINARQGGRLTPLAEKAYFEIKQLVLTNKLRGGEYVLEEDLTQAVGMSRTPLREALVQLQNDGLVAIVPRRGVRIVPLTKGDVREVYDILRWLESAAASRLARRPDREACVVELRRIVAQMDEALSIGDIDAWSRANDLFHARLVASSGNGRLMAICATLLDQSQRVRAFTLRLRSTPTRATHLHAEMVRAIAAGEADRAATIQAENKQAWMVELEEIFERLQIEHL